MYWSTTTLPLDKQLKQIEKLIMNLTLFCLNKCAIPPVRALTAPLFCAIIFSRFNEIPWTNVDEIMMKRIY